MLADFRDANDLQTQLLKEKLRQMHVLSEGMLLHKKLLQFWALKPEKLQDKLPLSDVTELATLHRINITTPELKTVDIWHKSAAETKLAHTDV